LKVPIIKTLSKIIPILIILGLLFLGISIFREATKSDAVRSLEQQAARAKIENKIAFLEAWGQVQIVLVYAGGGTLILLIVGGGLVALAFTGKAARSLHAVNGLFPLIVERPNVVARLLGQRDPVVINPNLQLGPVGRYREIKGGIQAIIPVGDTEKQLIATSNAQRVQLMQAMTGSNGIKYAAQAKYASGYYDRPNHQITQMDETPALPAPQEPMPLQLAMNRAGESGEIILGQAQDRGFVRAVWRPVMVPHLAVWGSTQQGKTSGIGFSVALQLIAAGYLVFILDVEEEANWSVLNGWAEYHPTDPTQFPGQVKALADEWTRRGEILRQSQTSNWSALPASAQERRMAIIVEEYGRIRTQAGDYGNLDDIDRVLGDLAARGGKRGMHLVLLDQHYRGQFGKWPGPVLNNAGSRVTFRQPVEDYSLAGYYGLQSLARGQFAYEGNKYDSYHARPHAQTLLANVPTLDARPIIGSNGRSFAISDPARQNRPATPVPPVLPTPPPPPAQPEETELQQAARRWLAAHPDSTQAAMRQALAIHNGGKDVAQGYGHELWHRYHPNGNEYSPPPATQSQSKATPAAPDWGSLDKSTLLNMMESNDTTTAAAALAEWERRGERISYGGQ